MCDVLLTDVEVVLKDKDTGEYYDSCGNCLAISTEALEELEDTGEVQYGKSWGSV